MKKTFLIVGSAKRISAAILTSIVILSATANVNAADRSESKTKTAISFVSSESNLMKFNINYTNTNNANVVVELTDETGELLYYREFADKIIDKTIYLKSVGEKCQVKFSVRAGKDIITERFDIEPHTTLVKETVVTKM